MRKSHYIAILLGGAAAFTLWNLASKHESPQGPPGDGKKVYGDAKACADDGNGPEECAKAHEAAKEEHARQAPKFNTVAECEAAGYAKCEEAPRIVGDTGSHSFFMPMMIGYMMGRMGGFGGGFGGGYGGYGGGFGGGAPQPQPAGASAGGAGAAGVARPVYADRNGYLYSRGGEVGRIAPGTTTLGSRAVSRGGFGASASATSGGS